MPFDVGRKRPLEPQRLGLELHAVFKVLERLQGQVEEVARAGTPDRAP